MDTRATMVSPLAARPIGEGRAVAMILRPLAGQGQRRRHLAETASRAAEIYLSAARQAERRLGRLAKRVSMASQMPASRQTPSKRSISWMPVGEVVF